MKKGMDTFNKGSRWLGGRDSGLNVWQSNWTNGDSFRGLIQDPITREASQLEVKDFMIDTGWDWGKIPFDLPIEVRRLIQATPVTLLSRGVDKLAWSGSPKGTFDLKSAYRIAMGAERIEPFSAHWIWKVNTLPRIRTFLWKCAHNRIGVKVCLERRGVSHDTTCPLCQEGAESILHALRDCPLLKGLWNQ